MRSFSPIQALESKRGDPGLKIALSLVCLLEAADGAFTRASVVSGAAKEANPLLGPWTADPRFLIMKVVGGVACAILLWIVYLRFPKLAVTSAASLIAFYGAVLVWNATTVLFF
jgi:hypothetical protein